MGLSVLVAVTHLVGVGHLARAAALARGFARAGHRVTLVSGGFPAPLVATDGLAFVQLPPVRVVGTDFSTLVGEAGPIRPEVVPARRRALLDALAQARPDVVITEHFPFGRRVLADEFMALIEEARARWPRPLVVASVRDVLVTPRPSRIAEAEDRLAALYDAVLVHGDPALCPLDASWPVGPRLRPLLRYTGYVDEQAGSMDRIERRDEIVVSGGGSAAALPLYRVALAAARRSPRPWRLLVGIGVDEQTFAGLREAAPANATIERARPDFRALLRSAAASVSQAGYNTVVDLLAAQVRPVLVPYEAAAETEQRLRAERLAAHGLAQVVPAAELSPERLLAALEAAPAAPPPPPGPVRLDGVARSVAAVEALAGGRAAPAVRVAPDWAPLTEALARLADRGRTLTVWWRDDDATAHTPALDRLLALSESTGAPVAIAAIPALAEPSLAARLADAPGACVLVHGLAHADHAPAGERKAELGPHRPVDALLGDAAAALRFARATFGDGLLPVLVPPWNRIAPALIPHLPGLGYRGLSASRGTPEAVVPGLVRADVDFDPIDWRGSGGLRAPAELVAALAQAVRMRIDGPGAPLGLLTHHLRHDLELWAFCHALLDTLGRHPAVRFRSASAMFVGGAPRAASGVAA